VLPSSSSTSSHFSLNCYTLKMKTKIFSETSLTIYQSKRRKIPDKLESSSMHMKCLTLWPVSSVCLLVEASLHAFILYTSWTYKRSGKEPSLRSAEMFMEHESILKGRQNGKSHSAWNFRGV
jgi:hypothetical protein